MVYYVDRNPTLGSGDFRARTPEPEPASRFQVSLVLHNNPHSSLYSTRQYASLITVFTDLMTLPRRSYHQVKTTMECGVVEGVYDYSAFRPFVGERCS